MDVQEEGGVTADGADAPIRFASFPRWAPTTFPVWRGVRDRQGLGGRRAGAEPRGSGGELRWMMGDR
jgi:hypothetical protein